ncbi:hypothetical protein GM668_04915 [Duganella ginsengisoli]|uniref:DUF1453 family protein n=1 Tax=Pseudoduganella ginsengisoli TaxID=1462440 RepID=A0A6L6PVF8_9BURK|nr:hypothetical protein [Pseudoduganella ginsengisoli]
MLGFLVVRGVAASRTRTVTYRSLFIMPAVMLALALNSIMGRFDGGALLAAVWFAAMAVGAALAWRFSDGQVAAVDHNARTVQLRGSWTPLALMMAVFAGKYVVGAAMGMNPALAHNTSFAMTACALFGLCNGVFNGRLLRCMAACRGAAAPMVRAA